MLYGCYSCYLAVKNTNAKNIEEKLFDESAYPFKKGPVYKTINDLRSQGILFKKIDNTKMPELDELTQSIIDEITELYEFIMEHAYNKSYGQGMPYKRARTVMKNSNDVYEIPISDKDIILHNMPVVAQWIKEHKLVFSPEIKINTLCVN